MSRGEPLLIGGDVGAFVVSPDFCYLAGGVDEPDVGGEVDLLAGGHGLLDCGYAVFKEHGDGLLVIERPLFKGLNQTVEAVGGCKPYCHLSWMELSVEARFVVAEHRVGDYLDETADYVEVVFEIVEGFLL